MDAYLYKPVKDLTVQCYLCSHRCIVKAGKRGKCRVRENRAGKLETLVYGRVIAQPIDPIEKKPLYHFLPGSLSYSIATVGCNFTCRFCQNADIAQLPRNRKGAIVGERISPDSIVAAAIKGQCRSIAYTYTEPTVFFEFAHDTAKLAHQKGIKNVFVTNGFMTAEALEMIRPFLDGANVDLKAYQDKYYTEVCGARLRPVMDTLKLMKSMGIWLEVTTLIVPGLNDSDDELRSLAAFIFNQLGPETPWHISRFHPTYQLTDRPPTPVDTLSKARRIGLEVGLRYVYMGNVPGDIGGDTYCYECGQPLIERWGYHIRKYDLEGGKCPHCRSIIDGLHLS